MALVKPDLSIPEDSLTISPVIEGLYLETEEG